MTCSPFLRPLFVVPVLLSLAMAGGCIHPNLPSVRYGTEPAPLLEEFVDGESFEVAGDVRPGFPAGGFGERIEQEFVEQPYCEGDGYLTDRSGSHHQPDTPEAPWPRFHPLPTRPVLGSY